MDRNVCNPFIKTVATFQELNNHRLNVFMSTNIAIDFFPRESGPSVDTVAHLNDVYCQVTYWSPKKAFYTLQLQS